MTCEASELVIVIEAKPATSHGYPRPRYSEAFRCLAGACDENCCNGWTIPIDTRTHADYLAHPVLKPFAQSLIVLNEVDGAASMPLTHQGNCAFLNEEKLCGIHAHFGPSLLSRACATYPREAASHGGEIEAALNLSCPEAARLTLLDPTLLGSGPWEHFGPRRYAHLAPASSLPGGFDPLLALREFALLVMTDPTYLLWQRMHLLGTLARELELLAGRTPARRWAETHPTAIASLIWQLASPIAHHLDELPKVSPDPTRALRFTGEILRQRLAEPPVPERFLATVPLFLSGLGCSSSHPTPHTDLHITQTFEGAYRHHARPLLDRHPHLVENFLINHLFKYTYPFGRSQDGSAPGSPTEQHLTLVAHLALTQTLLVGLAAHHREDFKPEHVVRLIQGLSKAIEHRPRSVAHLLETVRSYASTREAQGQLLALA
jgi:lysine-N-methylase